MLTKTIISFIIGALVGCGLSIYAALKALSFVLTMVPVGPWAGLIKVGITFFAVITGGGIALAITLGVAALIGALFGAFTLWVTGEGEEL